MEFIKILMFCLSAVFLFMQLLRAHKLKKKIKKYPQSISKSLIKNVKLALVLNYFNAIIALVTAYYIHSSFSFILIVLMSFIAYHCGEMIKEYQD